MDKILIIGFLLIILCLIIKELACKGETNLGNCLKTDRDALTHFKIGLKSSNNWLSSWRGLDCCQWEGIDYENKTRAIISVDLLNPYSPKEAYENGTSMNLCGEIGPSLIELKSLRYLDLNLSDNSFEHIPIPKFFGSLKNLQYLNLSNCGFKCAILPTLENLSNLQFLDLSSDEFQLFVKDLEWMTNLVFLRHLKLNYANLLSGSISSLNSINFTSLSIISISGNSFRSKFPIWVLNLSSLIYIDASSNKLYGKISPGLGELPNLQTCTIPECLSQLEKLTYLDLSNNKLQGLILASYRTFKNLNENLLELNELNGSLPISFGQLSNLVILELSGNRPSFPTWLKFQKDVNTLALSDASISGSIPNCSNLFQGSIPLPNPGCLGLDLSKNKFFGSIPAKIGESMPNLKFLLLLGNQIIGIIPESIGYMSSLEILDISRNSLTRSIPSSITRSITSPKQEQAFRGTTFIFPKPINVGNP
ncbi:hypothetical protein AAG906_004803 [Vitis piasezkii]